MNAQTASNGLMQFFFVHWHQVNTCWKWDWSVCDTRASSSTSNRSILPSIGHNLMRQPSSWISRQEKENEWTENLKKKRLKSLGEWSFKVSQIDRDFQQWQQSQELTWSPAAQFEWRRSEWWRQGSDCSRHEMCILSLLCPLFMMMSDRELFQVPQISAGQVVSTVYNTSVLSLLCLQKSHSVCCSSEEKINPSNMREAPTGVSSHWGDSGKKVQFLMLHHYRSRPEDETHSLIDNDHILENGRCLCAF